MLEYVNSLMRSWSPGRGPRRKGGFKDRPWHTRDFDSETEVVLCHLGDDQALPYGDSYMLKLSSIAARKSGGGGPAAVDKEMEAAWPAIHLMMTATLDDEGKLRKTATITLVAEDGMFKGGLRDRDANASLWKAARTFDGVLDAIEAALTSGDAEWRTSPPPSRK